jgi:hypothetical protein
MATAAQVLKAALQRILVQASEADLEPDEYKDAMFAMNNLMLDLDASGINLGYTEVSSLGDTITVPAGALRGIIANVAVEIAPDYNGVITPALGEAATNGMDTMRKLGIAIYTSSLPSTLPIGSGNEGCGDLSSDFYPDEEDEILAETTGSIGLETGTGALV